VVEMLHFTLNMLNITSITKKTNYVSN